MHGVPRPLTSKQLQTPKIYLYRSKFARTCVYLISPVVYTYISSCFQLETENKEEEEKELRSQGEKDTSGGSNETRNWSNFRAYLQRYFNFYFSKAVTCKLFFFPSPIANKHKFGFSPKISFLTLNVRKFFFQEKKKKKVYYNFHLDHFSHCRLTSPPFFFFWSVFQFLFSALCFCISRKHRS